MRSLRWGPRTPVYIDDVIAAEVLEDDGEGDVLVRYEATRETDRVAFARISRRHVAAQPPPGAGGRDVPPLDFGDRNAPGPDHVEPYRWRGWRQGPERGRR